MWISDDPVVFYVKRKKWNQMLDFRLFWGVELRSGTPRDNETCETLCGLGPELNWNHDLAGGSP